MSIFRANIEAMTGYVPGEQPPPGKVIKLNTNENPYACSPQVARAIERACAQGLARYPDPHATAFRLRAAQVLGVAHALDVGPEWILCGNGSDDILTIVTRAFVGEGELVRYPTPSYVLYRTLAEIQGARIDEVPFAANWTLGSEFAAPADDLRLVFLANPNSPSGTMIAPDQVLKFADALPCPLLVDEAYVDFADTDCLALVARNEKIMVARTLSKSYALAGLRFGFLVAQPHIIEQLAKVKDSYNCDALSIAGACAAIDDQAWRAENREKIVTTRTRLIRAMRQLGFDPPDSQANFVWNPHPALPVQPIYERLKKAGILVRYMDYPGIGDGLRITVGTDSQIDACLDLLKTLI